MCKASTAENLRKAWGEKGIALKHALMPTCMTLREEEGPQPAFRTPKVCQDDP